MSVATTIAKSTVSLGVKKLMAQFPSARTSELYGQMAQEAAFESEGFLQRMVERLGGDPDAALQRLADTVTEEQAASLLGRLIPEAVFSATKERRRLMAAAMAGVFDPDFDLERKSRITRALATLEPSDVVTLRKLRERHEAFTRGVFVGEEPDQTAALALTLAGCIALPDHAEKVPDEPRLYRVTQLGSSILSFLADWEPTASPPQEL